MNGRIEIELGGKVRQLRFNNYAKEELGRLVGKDPIEGTRFLLQTLNDRPTVGMKYLVLSGMVGHYEARELERDFTSADIAEWLEDVPDDKLVPIFECWLDTTKLRELIKLPEEKEGVTANSEKKRLPGKKSKILQ